MATTSPDGISYPTNVSSKKTIEGHIQDTVTSTQTALNSKANLAGANTYTGLQTFSGNVAPFSITRQDSSYEGAQINFSRASDNTFSWGLDVYGNTSSTDFRIFNTSYTPFQINTNGVVTMPNQPRFFANRSGDLTGYNPSGQSNPIVYNSVAYNIGNHYNASTGKFTAPVAGVYSFTVGSYQSVNVSQLWPVLNGSRAESFVATAVSNNWAGSFTRYLNANDNIGVLAWSDGNTNVTVYANWYHTYFSGYLVG